MNNNIIKSSTNTTGTGVIDLAANTSGLNRGYTNYSIYSNGQFERGQGLFFGQKLYRDFVTRSSNGTARITLSGTSDVVFEEPDRNNVYYISSPAVGHTLFYSSTGWNSRPLSSGDITTALGYVPGTGSGGGGGSGITLPIQMYDVNGLLASLSGKQPVGSYATQSDITNLQATKSPVGHTHTVSEITDFPSSGLSSNSVGVFNVTNYGVSVTGDALQNTLNFQKALDAAVYANRLSEYTNGATVVFPGTAENKIELQWPTFINSDNMMIKGEGMLGTTVRSFGPMICTMKHPKYASVLYGHFDDKFAVSGTLTNSSRVITSVGYVDRIRLGAAINGVGIQSDTLVTGISTGTNTIYINKTASTNGVQALNFSCDKFYASGNIAGNTTISNIQSGFIDRIRVGALVTGTNIQNDTYVLSVNSTGNYIRLNKSTSGFGDRNLGIGNYVSSKFISISGITQLGSTTISGISSTDINRIFVNTSILGNNINDAQILKVGPTSIDISSPALSTGPTSLTVYNGWFDIPNYWEDISLYGSGSLFPPGSGRNAFNYSETPGNWKAFRSRGNIGQLRSPGSTLSTGNPLFNHVPIPWFLYPKITWEFLLYHHDAYLKGGIIGTGGVGAPDPWFLSAGEGFDTNPKYIFDVAVTDKEQIERSVIRIMFPQNATEGIHRVTIQYDRDSQAFTTWVDGIQQTISVTMDLSPHVGGYAQMGGIDKLWGRWDRVAKWHYSEFVVGGSYSNLGKGTSILGNERESDFAVLGMACYKNSKYTVSTAGSAQIKVGGGNADDSFVWYPRPGLSNDSDAIGWLACSTTNAPLTNNEVNIHTKSWSKGGLGTWMFAYPRGEGTHGTAGAISNIFIDGFNIQKSEGSPLSCAIYTGPFLYLRVNDIKTQNFMASIWSCETVTCYDAYYTNLDLGSMIHLVHQIAFIENVKFPYIKYSAITTAGCQTHLKNFLCPSPEVYAYGFWSDYAAGSVNAGVYIEDGTINWEDFIFYPGSYQFYTQKRGDHGGNEFIMKNVTLGTHAVPYVILDDILPNSRFKGYVNFENTAIAGLSPGVKVRGRDWSGDIDIDSVAYFDDVIEYLPSYNSSIGDNLNLRATDNTSFGPPYCGGFVSDSVLINIKKPAEGGALSLVCKSNDPTGIYREGSAFPPTWIAEGKVGNSPSNLSVNTYNSIYMSGQIPWPTGKTTNLKLSSFQFSFANNTLNHLMTGKSADKRGYFKLGWGYGLPHPSVSNSILNDGVFFSSASLKVSDYFSPTDSNGFRFNKTGIPITSPGVPEWSIMLNRSATCSLQAGDSGENNVFIGKTTPIDSGFWKATNGQTLTLPSGSIAIKYVERESGWTREGAKRIIDYLLDGSANPVSSPSGANFPSTFYIGLSKTAVTSSGTNINEPTGASYARVAVTRSSGNWQELHNSVYMYSNKSSINFASPLEDWGYLGYSFISDSASGGNILHKAKLNSPVRVFAGDPALTFKKNAFQLQL